MLVAIGSVHALLALGLPFALEADASPTGSTERTFGGTEVWSGWSLARRSPIDGHHPVSTAVAIVMVAATVGLVVFAWLALERPRTRLWLALAAGVGGVLLVSSVPLGNALHGTFGDGHPGTSSWGLPVWRVALLLVVVAAIRSLAQAEADADGNRRPPGGPGQD